MISDYYHFVAEGGINIYLFCRSFSEAELYALRYSLTLVYD